MSTRKKTHSIVPLVAVMVVAIGVAAFMTMMVLTTKEKLQIIDARISHLDTSLTMLQEVVFREAKIIERDTESDTVTKSWEGEATIQFGDGDPDRVIGWDEIKPGETITVPGTIIEMPDSSEPETITGESNVIELPAVPDQKPEPTISCSPCACEESL